MTALGCGLAGLLITAKPAAAHDPRAVVAGSTTVTFGFTDGTPMAFATAQIFGPHDTLPYQELTSDRAGRVSFLPNREGSWRVEITDSEGHHLSTTMSLAHGVPVGSGQGIPDGLVALSLVLNFVLASVVFTKWRSTKQAKSASGEKAS